MSIFEVLMVLKMEAAIFCDVMCTPADVSELHVACRAYHWSARHHILKEIIPLQYSALFVKVLSLSLSDYLL